jgi:hypothetical protein
MSKLLKKKNDMNTNFNMQLINSKHRLSTSNTQIYKFSLHLASLKSRALDVIFSHVEEHIFFLFLNINYKHHLIVRRWKEGH